MRRFAIIAVTVLAVVAAILLLLHTPFVRARVLRYALATVQEQYAMRLEADRLDYNLATLRIGLANLRLSARGPGPPFFEAEYLSVTLPREALLGALAFDDISITNGLVRVLRREDGTTNLPESSQTPAGEPPPLRIARLAIARLAVDIRDEQNDLSFQIPPLAIELMADEGRIAMASPAELRVGTRMTRLSALEGGAAFDGRALRLSDVALRADEGDARATGFVELIARDPQIDLRLQGTGNVARMARWAMAGAELPEGEAAFDARVAGALAGPVTELQVTSSRLAWQRLAAIDVSTRARVTPGGAEVDNLEFGLAEGRVTASGAVPFQSDAAARLRVALRDVDGAALALALDPQAQVVPASTVFADVDLEGPLGDPMRWNANARLRLDPGANAPRRISVAGAASLELRDGAWQLRGRQTIGAASRVAEELRGRLPVSAAQPLARSTVEGTLRFDETDMPALLSVLRTTRFADVRADTVASGSLDADVNVAGRLDDPQVRVQARLLDLKAADIDADTIQATIWGAPLTRRLSFAAIAGPARIAGERVRDVKAAGRLTGDLVSVDELVAAQADGPGIVTGSGTYNLRTAQYAGALEATEWQLTPTADRPLAGRANVRVNGAGTTDAPGGTGRVVLRAGAWDDVGLGDLEADLLLEGKSATIEARAPDFHATATGRVQLTAPYPAVVDLKATDVDLARVLKGIETPTPVQGTVTLAAHAEGALDTWRSGTARVEIGSLDATAGDLLIRLVEAARLRYEGARVYVDRLEAAAGDTRLSASGELPAFDPAPDDPALLVTVTGDVDAVARAVAATRITDVPITGGEGPVAVLARVTGSAQSPVVAANLEVGPGSVALMNLAPITDLTIRAHAGDGWVELREAAAVYQGAMIEATGRAPLSLVTDGRVAAGTIGELAIRARATNVTPAVLDGFVDPSTVEQLGGSLDGVIEVRSPTLDVNDAVGEIRLDRMNVRLANLPVTQRAPTRVVIREGFARIEAWDWIGQGAILGVRGQVRLSDQQAAILANGAIDLRTLTPFVREAGITTRGRLEPRLAITGTPANPRIDGDMLVSGGEVRIADPRVFITDLAARAVLTGRSAHLTSITGLANGGPLTGDGVVTLGPDGEIEARLATDVNGMALEFPPGLRSEVDASLALDLTIAPEDAARTPAVRDSGNLTGTVTVVRGSYRQPLAVVTGLLANLRTRRLAASADPSPLLESLNLDVRLITDEDMIVDNNYGRLLLGGDLRVIGTAASPALSGRAELREGGRLFVGRNVYTINSGTIDFANPVTIEPDLDIDASTRAGGEDIVVNITGTPENMSVDMRSTSDPALGEAEITSLLLTGRRFEDLNPGDAAFVGTQVLGNFSAEVLGFASQAVGLDSVRLGGVDTTTVRRDPTAAATEIDPTTRLTFGKSLGPDVDITLSQSLRDGDAQTWIVDYVPIRRLELRLVSDDEDLRSYGFRHDMTFGGGTPRPIESAAVGTRAEDLTVSRVDLAGDLAFPEEQVRRLLRVEAGERFDFIEWQSDRDRLETFYHREGHLTARIGATRLEGDGVVLRYDIAPGPQTAITATGVELDADLRSRLETAWSQAVFDEFLVDEATAIVRERLASEGYLQPKIVAQVTDDVASGRKTLTIAVERGTRTGQRRVRISGADEALTGEIDAFLATSGLNERAATDPGAVERELTAWLRSNGRLRANVTAGAALFEDGTAVVPVTVQPGPVFTIASLGFEGAGPLPLDSLRETAALNEGDPYDPAEADRARERLVALYRREGFPSPAVTARQTVRPDAPLVDLVYVIEPGTRQVLAEIAVSGNRAIDTDVVVRALDLRVGEPLRAEESLQGRRRVFDTGLFRRVEVSPEPLSPPASASSDAPMRLRVTVEEWPSLRVRYGFQVAEERPEGELDGRELVPGVTADLTRRTLFGRAIAVGGALTLQRREQMGRVFLNAPTLLGGPIESSLIVEAAREEFPAVTLLTERRGVVWEQRTRVLDDLTLAYSYRFDRDHTFNTAADPNDPFRFDLTVNIARLTGSGAWDDRDDPVDATSGSLLSSSLEYAADAVGSEFQFIKNVTQAYYFRPWRGAVLASAARVGLVRPLAGQDLLQTEKFFAGGAGTVRGVPEDSLGARDFFGAPRGGQGSLVLNQEFRVPVYRWVRFVGFVDAGNVFERPSDVGLGNLVGSVGFGVRLATPFALLRADVARPAWGPVEQRSFRWTFGIGQAF